MPIFKLKQDDGKVENAVLVPASKTSIGLEKHLEGWIENSPWAIAQEPLLIRGTLGTPFASSHSASLQDQRNIV